MAIMTTTLLPPAVQLSFNGKLLSTPVANHIYGLFAERRTMPKGGGSIMRFRRYTQLAPALVALGNTGVTPVADLLVTTDIDVLIQYYGNYLLINEQVQLTAQDNVLNAAAERLGVQLRDTEDILTSQALLATASQVNCVGGINGRIVAVVKSLLIDLEAEVVARLTGDRAEGRMATVND
jgi:N4-gp56 family major capsid protein